jgi:hypothetical protein
MMGLSVTMLVFFYAANLAFQTFEPRLSSRPLAANAMKILTPDDHLIVYGEFAQACSFSFYLGRGPMWIYNGRYNGLEFGSHFADAPQIFLDDEQFDALWTSTERTFLFVPPEQRGDALAQLSRTHKFFVSESGSKTLYANQPIGRTQTGARLEPH